MGRGKHLVMTSEPEIDFARYAEVSAYLGHFPGDKRHEVLSRLGHRRRAWEASVARWTAARDAEILDGRADLTERFGKLVTRTRERLAAQRPALESLGPLLPREEEEAPPPPAPEPLPPAATPEVQLSTAQIAPVPEVRPGLPSFLAWGEPRADPVSRPPVPPAIVVDAPRAPVAPASYLAATALPSLPSPAPELPFRQGAPGQAEWDARIHARAVQQPSEPPRRSALGDTAALGEAPSASPLPFTAPLSPGCPDFTVLQYASLRVELQAKPAEEAAILARYWVAPGARADLDDHWRRRFEADPPSRMEFVRAYAAYLAWLRQQAG
jgi:hypothetical protein